MQIVWKRRRGRPRKPPPTLLGYPGLKLKRPAHRPSVDADATDWRALRAAIIRVQPTRFQTLASKVSGVRTGRRALNIPPALSIDSVSIIDPLHVAGNTSQREGKLPALRDSSRRRSRLDAVSIRGV